MTTDKNFIRHANVSDADLASTLVREAMEKAISLDVPLGVCLAAAHACVIGEMVAAIGGDATADRCSSAAANVRGLPSQAAHDLAMSPAVGSA